MATAVATVEAGSGQNKIVAAKKQVIGIFMVIVAVIGMGLRVHLMGQLALHLMELGVLSWILETVLQVELLMLP